MSRTGTGTVRVDRRQRRRLASAPPCRRCRACRKKKNGAQIEKRNRLADVVEPVQHGAVRRVPLGGGGRAECQRDNQPRSEPDGAPGPTRFQRSEETLLTAGRAASRGGARGDGAQEGARPARRLGENDLRAHGLRGEESEQEGPRRGPRGSKEGPRRRVRGEGPRRVRGSAEARQPAPARRVPCRRAQRRRASRRKSGRG